MTKSVLDRCKGVGGSGPFWVRAVLFCLLAGTLPAYPPLLAFDDEAGQESGCIRLASYSDLPTFQKMNAPIRQLYKEAGVCVEIRYVPIQRAHGMQLQGRVHGQIGRVAAWLKEYGHDVVMMKEPLLRLDAMLAFKSAAGQGALPSSFKGRTVAHQAAVVWCSSWVVAQGAHSLPVQDFKDAGALLDAGRAEFVLFLTFKQQTLPNLSPDHYRFAKVDDVDIYHVLAKEKAHLMPQLDAALERLGGPAYFEQYLLPEIKDGG